MAVPRTASQCTRISQSDCLLYPTYIIISNNSVTKYFIIQRIVDMNFVGYITTVKAQIARGHRYQLFKVFVV